MQDKINKKIEYFKHRLLDLGRRNRMINYRKNLRSALTLTVPSFEELYRRIVVGEKSLSFRRPITRRTDPKVFSVLTLMQELSYPLEVYVGDIDYDRDMDSAMATLRYLRARAALALEEQGSNILYLSFGFLEWNDGRGDDRVRSPLIMVPVTLTNTSPTAPYFLKKRDEDIVVNPTLAYCFESTLGITLPTFDEGQDTLASFMKKMEDFADTHGFTLTKEASLGLLSFQKISMYRDLEANEDRIRRHPILRALCGEKEAIDRTHPEKEPPVKDPYSSFSVLSADSSQQDAIEASKKGMSFVMQGPPGTGKSQTITNIIAEALAQGKKILFVSEKMAALHVVYRRLEEAGLADFCLPLHSAKANKRQILENIGAVLKLKRPHIKEDALRTLETLSMDEKRLNAYAEALHEKISPLGRSLYEIYGEVTALANIPSLAYHEEEPLSVSGSLLAKREVLLERYGEALAAMGALPKDNPWQGITESYTAYAMEESLQKSLASLVNALTVCKNTLAQNDIAIEDCDNLSFGGFEKWVEEAELYLSMPTLPLLWQKDQGALERALSLAKELLEGEESLHKLEERCESVFYPEIRDFDRAAFDKNQLTLSSELLEIGIPYAKGQSFEEKRRYLEEYSESLLEAVKNGIHYTATFEEARKTLSPLLGKTLSSQGSLLAFTEELLLLMHRDNVILPTWQMTQLSELRQLAAKAKAVAEALKEGRARVLARWEKEVFSLDAEEYYLRFQKSYSGMRKLFSGQYYQDLQYLRSFYKGYDKPDEETLVKLLLSLRTLKEMEGYFQQHSEELSFLGAHYHGADTDWQKVEEDLAFYASLWDLEGKEPSHTIKALFSQTDRSAALHTVMMAHYAMKSAFDGLSSLSELLLGQRLTENTSLTKLSLTLPLVESLLEKLVKEKETLAAYRKDPALSREALTEAFQLLQEKGKREALLKRQRETAKIVFGKLYEGDCDSLSHLVTLLSLEKHRKEMPFGEILFDPARKRELAASLAETKKAYCLAKKAMAFLKEAFPHEAFEEYSFGKLKKRSIAMLKTIGRLGEFVRFEKAKKEAEETGLSKFLALYEETLPQGEVATLYRKAFFESFIKARQSASEALRSFHKGSHTASVKRFASLDEKSLTLARLRIRDRLIASMPDAERTLRAEDEVTILQRELQKRRGIMPLRKLFKSIPHLLLRLKPCLMMSPLSVSYFLEAENYNFDLVIFDEASQIFPEDAIGAILRGKQVIIVGDTKQLPPTDFFATHTAEDDSSEEDEEEESEDSFRSESILETMAEALPNKTLLWHYRSRHEHLIAFSNRMIYQNSLITFPSCEGAERDTGIEYVYVPDGVYEGGGKNCNRREAEECVSLVREHIIRNPERSLGIIAFSEKQQKAIEDAIMTFREENPLYEFFFAEGKEEPFFVKNLENVQGDERDTIIFSIGYAKDKRGKLYMRFGPLGQEGGERRLNVAVTRAKENIKLVGSILPADIDLARTSAEGVRMLRNYIDFAINGEEVLPGLRHGGEEREDLFADYIASIIEKAGYPVRRRVGCSDYKLDIAVLHPDRRETVIAAVECDGFTYYAAHTARDRDHLRSAILSSMGWKCYRLWSTAFMKNEKEEREALLAFLEDCLKGEGEAALISLPEGMTAYGENAQETESFTEAPESAKEQTHKTNPHNFAYYEEADWARAPHSGSKDRNKILAERLLYVIEIEGPIHKDLLYRRMAPGFRAGKVTEGVKETVNTVLASLLSQEVTEDAQGFVSLKRARPVKARIPKEGATPRPMEYIPKEEVADAILTLLAMAFGITPEELTIATAHAFGFERVGPKIKAKIEEALFSLMLSERIALSGGKVILQ